MNTPPKTATDKSSADQIPAERLERLGELSPVRLTLPKSVVVTCLCIVIALAALVLAGTMISEQARIVFKLWIDRIIGNIF